MTDSIPLASWAQRPRVIASMLNPVVVSALLAAATNHYEKRDSAPMPIELSFLIAPLILHRDSREALPRRDDSHLTKWTSNHTILLAGFPDRARELAPIVREGVRHGLRHGHFSLTETGELHSEYPAKRKPSATGDIRQLINSSARLGRWFARTNSPATIYALFGVKP